MVKICLNMIVKNESKTIKRLLESVVSIIDHYVICDTGSTDNTIEIIIDFFKDKNIEGTVKYHQWVNFGYNRNLALKESKVYDDDYVLLLDADMVLVLDDFYKNKLTHDVYFLKQVTSDLSYYNVRLIKKNIEVTCIGSTHEYYSIKEPYTQYYIPSMIYINDIGDGGSKIDKFERDIKFLEKDLETDPENPRTYFYLAQSYECIGKTTEAINNYHKRLSKGGWTEEIYISLYRLGNLYQKLQDYEKSIFNYLQCHNINNNRKEHLYKLGKFYREREQYNLANHFINLGLDLPEPASDILFKEKNVYEYLMNYENSINIFYTKRRFKKREGTEISNMLLLSKRELNIPNDIYNNILSNIKFYIEPIKIEKNKEYDIYDLYPTGTNFRNCYNPSITTYKGFTYVSFRLSNYNLKIENNKMYYKVYDGDKLQDVSMDYPIRSKTELTIVDEEMDLIGTTEKFNFKNSIFRFRSCIRGVEDIRIIEYNDIIYMIGNSCELNEKNINKMVCIKYNPQNFEFQILELYGYEDHKVQKNWSPFTLNDKLYFIYSFSPLIILEPDLSTGECKVVHNQPQTKYYDNFRGGSQGIRIGNNIYFIVHEVIPENGRIYIHRIVKMNGFDIIGVSRPFYLKSLGIEYVSGAIYDNQKFEVIITWGSNDKTANITSISASTFLNMLD